MAVSQATATEGNRGLSVRSGDMRWAGARLLVRASGAGLLAALCLIGYYAFKPAGSGGGFFPWDKADHFCAFFVVTVLAISSFPRQSLITIAIGVAILGGLIEIVQGLPFINRDCDVWDWVAEMVALTCVYGVMLAAKIRRRTQATIEADEKSRRRRRRRSLPSEAESGHRFRDRGPSPGRDPEL